MISMVMVAVGVYARLMKHAGREPSITMGAGDHRLSKMVVPLVCSLR